MALLRVAASPLPLVLLPSAAALLALLAAALAPAPAAHAALTARARSLQADAVVPAWAVGAARRHSRSPEEQLAAQRDGTESVDPDSGKTTSFFKRLLEKCKQFVQKGIEVAKKFIKAVGEAVEAMGCTDKSKDNGDSAGGGGGDGNVETMSPDRLRGDQGEPGAQQ